MTSWFDAMDGNDSIDGRMTFSFIPEHAAEN